MQQRLTQKRLTMYELNARLTRNLQVNMAAEVRVRD